MLPNGELTVQWSMPPESCCLNFPLSSSLSLSSKEDEQKEKRRQTKWRRIKEKKNKEEEEWDEHKGGRGKGEEEEEEEENKQKKEKKKHKKKMLKNKTPYLWKLALCTSHRRGNTGRGYCDLATAVLELFAWSFLWCWWCSLSSLCWRRLWLL